MFAGQVIVGGVVSTTVTLPVHWLVAPLLSMTVNNTLVVPSAYGPAGACVIVRGPPSGSDEPLLIEALAVQLAPADTVTFWHVAIGGWLAV
jgi:hypothetical protein